MNNYFYKIWLPFHAIFIASTLLVFINAIEINWVILCVSWFLIGPVGIGIGFHRLFSHRQFKTWRPIEILLACLGTLAAYGPLLYWVTQHQYHHKHTDTDKDINDPKKGFWHSFLYWRLTKNAENFILLKDKNSLLIAKDKIFVWLSKYFISIIYLFALTSLLFGPSIFISMFVFPIFIEHFRINILNSLAHLNIPGSYKNFSHNDNSQNNFILGIITFGFGWHNNHHANPGELINTHKWWELDIEGQLAKLISKKS